MDGCVVNTNKSSPAKVCPPFWDSIAWGVWGHVGEDESVIGLEEAQACTFVAVGIKFTEV